MPTIVAVPDDVVRNSNDANILFDPLTQTHIAVQNRIGNVSPNLLPTKYEIGTFGARARRFQERTTTLENVPSPGGFGAGVNFKADQLLFQNSTAIFFYLLIPPSLGGDPTADLLYMTSSNRASKGCEALISFFKERNYRAAFMIWDWSVPPDSEKGQFVVTMDYDQLQPYRIPLSITSNTGHGQIGFDALYIVNSTRRAGDAWVNEVYLHNHQTGMRDRVWQHSFTWPSEQTDAPFWWGPIFETFPDDAAYETAPPLGFADALMVQDGATRKLTVADSELKAPANGLQLLWQESNSGLIAKGLKA